MSRLYEGLVQRPAIHLVGTPIHENLGDHAIALGILAFAKCYFPGHAVNEIPTALYPLHKPHLIRHIKPGDLIFCSGGGNMGDVYPEEERLRRDVIATFPGNCIAIFPQTLYFTATLQGYLERVETQRVYNRHPALTVVARDKGSYERMKALFPSNDVLLMPDMAMTADFPVVRRRRSGVLLCLRSDGESVLTLQEREALADRFRRSRVVRCTDTAVDRVFLPEERAKAVRDKLREFSFAELVVTDRLHGMVFAAITGTPCVAIDNFNGKLSSAGEWFSGLGYIRHAQGAGGVPAAIEQLQEGRARRFDWAAFAPYLECLAEAVGKGSVRKPAAGAESAALKYNVGLCDFAPRPSTLSAVTVTNADRPQHLVALLDSLRPLCDETVVILDNEDPSVAHMLAEHADTVKPAPGKGAFEAYVGDLFRHCTKDWILRVDSDETLGGAWTRDLVLRLVSDCSATHYWIPRRWYVSESQYIDVAPWFPDYQLRLFRNLPGIVRMPATIHEPMAVSGESRRVDGHYIEHWDLCLNDRDAREMKVDHYNRLRPFNGCDIFYLYEDFPYDIWDVREAPTRLPPGNPDARFFLSDADVPAKMKRGLIYTIRIRLANRRGLCLLPGSNYLPDLNGGIFVSYHWYRGDQSVYCWDYDRVTLPDYFRPGDMLDVLLPVAAPPTPGEYFLQVDLVEEGVRWFSQTEAMLDSPLMNVQVL